MGDGMVEVLLWLEVEEEDQDGHMSMRWTIAFGLVDDGRIGDGDSL